MQYHENDLLSLCRQQHCGHIPLQSGWWWWQFSQLLHHLPCAYHKWPPQVPPWTNSAADTFTRSSQSPAQVGPPPAHIWLCLPVLCSCFLCILLHSKSQVRIIMDLQYKLILCHVWVQSFNFALIKKNGGLRTVKNIMHTYPEAIKEVPCTVGLIKLETSPIVSTVTFSYNPLRPSSPRPTQVLIMKVSYGHNFLHFYKNNG